MGTTIQYVDIVDNTNTLFSNVLVDMYGLEANNMLIYTKFLRTIILKTIKEFVDSEKTITIKEFSNTPPMIYNDSSDYNYDFSELKTDLLIVENAFNLEMLNTISSTLTKKLPLVVEALAVDNVKKSTWDDYLDQLFLYYSGSETEIHKIMIDNTINTLKIWDNLDDLVIKKMLKDYNASNNISYDYKTYWTEPFDSISKKYWKKFSFVLTLNDFDIYDPLNQKYLDIIAEKYFNNGYFDEIVIKINYFYWFDNFQKIIDWTKENLRSALVSYRFDGIFSNETKNRYYDETEALKYNDIQRKNTVNEELDMYETRLPILLAQILTNTQTYGFELTGGYFGKEGDVADLTINGDDFNRYKEIICKITQTSPFAKVNDNFVKIFRDPNKRIFVCMKV